MDPVFKKRLDQYGAELEWLYKELYYGDDQAYQYFISMLEDFYKKRSKELKAWDKEKDADPQWYKGSDLLGMLMYTNCFGGTIKGVKEHLDYVEECGVNYIHLMPLLESPKGRSDGGYAVSDFRKVQPQLGTMKDLSDLAKECR